MIEKLRRKFIAIAMLAVTIVLTIIMVAINLANYHQTTDHADDILTILSQYGGVFPNLSNRNNEFSFDTIFPGMIITVETPYETRYFRITTNDKDQINSIDLRNIQSIDYETALAFGREALSSSDERGYINGFRYLVTPTEDDGKLIIFVDNRREIVAFEQSLATSLKVSVLSLLAIFLLVVYFSKKLIKPYEENLERQKQFVTDAGHEIKTPLSIISANADVQEMTDGKTEWTRSTKKQIVRLNELVEDLLHLARFDENPKVAEKESVNFSHIVNDSVESFELISGQKGISFKKSLDDDLILYGNAVALEKLVSILLDNAYKYVSDNGAIEVILESNKKTIQFTVRNTVDVMPKDFDRLFDRFYREDESRSQSTGGYGIGLSLAQSITSQHEGKIQVKAFEDNIISFEVKLPLQS